MSQQYNQYGFMEDYYREQEEYRKTHTVNMCNIVDAIRNPTLNRSILITNINNIDTMDDSELWNFISGSYKTVLYNAFEKEGVDYLRQLQNIRVLNCLINVFSNSNIKIDNEDIIHCNTLCYHYMTLPKEMQDKAVLDRMVALSSTVNRKYMPSLLGLGLSPNLAAMILIARFSDLDINVCVKRVDFIIINQPKELMTEKMIEDIMRRLYNVFTIYIRIFPHLMMDVVPYYDENNESTWWVTEDIQEVDSYLGLAILNILDNLPSQTIRDVLKNYAQGQQMLYRNHPVRFSLRNLSEDYYRINNIIEGLVYEGVIVP